MGRRSEKSKAEMADQTRERKAEHLEICLEEKVNARKATTGFEDVHLIHRALPEINRKEIDLCITVFNHKFSAPIIVEAMTGGTHKSLRINDAVAQAVEELGLGMGVGSQRVALEDRTLEKTFTVVRERAPNAFLIANLGGAQLLRGYGLKEAKRAVEMIDADALAIHLNPLQEAIQPEGETDHKGILAKITEVVSNLDVPVIVKETGAGISAEEAKRLEAAGVAGIDVAGAGGTSWAAVEYHRAKRRDDESAQILGEMLWDWGVPTAVSLVEVVQSVNLPVIASGGVRSGKDVAKAMALGASLTGIALPALAPASKGSAEVKKMLRLMMRQLRNVMFLIGADCVERLRASPLVLTGKTAEWLRVRGFKPEIYARRGL
ncbi:MAG: type 2 isopentenyl-diphosphate Delta-isomerase [Candidatus Bathyarchaeia archaeon]